MRWIFESDGRLPRLSAARQVNDNACGRADEQQEARRRLNEEAGQPLVYGPTVAGEIHSTAYDPNDTEHCCDDVAQVGCTKPQRHQESWQPFERVHMSAENSLEIGVPGRCRESYVEAAVRRRNASCKKEIERYGEQCDD
jgi:hypothetical protein